MKDLTKLKPNELIRLAITDMKATISQGHVINMNDWGIGIGTPSCSVCFAGSVMLQQGKMADMYDSFEIVEDINQNAYTALDLIRRGRLDDFCERFKVENPATKKLGLPIHEMDIKYTKGKEEEFYAYMENIAKLFD
jgi:hypothetical protein